MPKAQFMPQSVPSIAFKLNELDRASNDDFSPRTDDYQLRLCVQPVLHRLGLSWENDVHEVYPVVGTSVWTFMKEMPLRHKGIVMTSASDPNLVCEAVKLCLTRWPIFRTVAVEYNATLRLLVALRAHKPYFDRAVSMQPEVESIEAFRKLNIPMAPHPRGEFFEGLSFNAVIARIKDTGTVGVLFIAEHASYDWRTLTSWATDLSRIIRREPAIDRAPYKMFADAYYTYQNAEPAKEAQDFHRRNFQRGDFSSDTFWPPPGKKALVPTNPAQTAKEPHHSDIQHQNQMQQQPASKGTTNNVAKGAGAGRVTEIQKCPTLREAYTQRGTHASIIVKTAICLFNVLQTGQSHALFRMVTSGRVWPFFFIPPPETPAATGYNNFPDDGDGDDPNKLAGPTLVTQVSVTSIAADDESINQLLARVQEEQKLLERYPHVPHRMLQQLNDESGGVRDQSLRQVFDWLPGYEDRIRIVGTGGGGAGLEVFAAAQDNNAPPLPAGAIWFCRLSGRGGDELMVRLVWDLELFSEEQAHGYVRLVHGLVRWICEPGNGGRCVGELRGVFHQEVRDLKRKGVDSKL